MDIKQQALRMYANGVTARKISEKLGMSTYSIYNWAKNGIGSEKPVANIVTITTDDKNHVAILRNENRFLREMVRLLAAKKTA
jgi:uncharacterized protein YjcR